MLAVEKLARVSTNLNPYQGLKPPIFLINSTVALSFNQSESLSGIETCAVEPVASGSTVSTNLNPYQGLKLPGKQPHPWREQRFQPI